MLASQLAAEQNIRSVIVPANLGTASAIGCLLSNPKYEYMQSYLSFTGQVTEDKLREIEKTLKTRARTDLSRDNITLNPEFEFCGDFRYSGEHWEVTVPLMGSGELRLSSIVEGASTFHSEHQRLYGFQRLDEPVEIVTIMMRMILPGFQLPPRKIQRVDDATSALTGTREVWFDPQAAEQANVYAYEKLGAGSKIKGPAIIQRHDGTVPLLPKSRCEIDDYGNILIALEP